MHCAVQILSVGQMVQESHMAGDTGSTREGECIFATKIILLHNVTISTLQLTTMSVQYDNHHSAALLYCRVKCYSQGVQQSKCVLGKNGQID